jgi:hypothetical protein
VKVQLHALLGFSFRWRRVASFMTWLHWPRRKGFQFLLDRRLRLGGLQSQSNAVGLRGGGENLLEIKP